MLWATLVFIVVVAGWGVENRRWPAAAKGDVP